MPVIDLTPPKICDPLALPTLPSLPTGVSLGVAIPGLTEPLALRLCCKTLFFNELTVLPPISLGAGAVLPIAIALNEVIAGINAYKRALPVLCPREL